MPYIIVFFEHRNEMSFFLLLICLPISTLYIPILMKLYHYKRVKSMYKYSARLYGYD